MKSEKEIKKAIEDLKKQLDMATERGKMRIHSQIIILKWVLEDRK